jgi:hypothetical protein
MLYSLAYRRQQDEVGPCVNIFQRLSHSDICRTIWGYSSDLVKSNSVTILSDMTLNPYANVLKMQNLKLSVTCVTQT